MSPVVGDTDLFGALQVAAYIEREQAFVRAKKISGAHGDGAPSTAGLEP